MEKSKLKNSQSEVQGGFTLIELLVVVAVLTIIASIGGDIMSSVFRAYNRASITSEVRHNGSLAMERMVRGLRDARRIVSPTSGSDTQIVFEDKDGVQITYIYQPVEIVDSVCVKNGRVDIEKTSPVSVEPLTNTDPISGVNIPGTGLTFTNSGGTPPAITIEMQMEQGCAATNRVDYKADVTLRSTVTLRNY